jgi:hypothetical protein
LPRRRTTKAAPDAMGKRKGAAGKEEGKALKGKEKAPRPHPLPYVVLWVSASARRPLLCEGRARRYAAARRRGPKRGGQGTSLK